MKTLIFDNEWVIVKNDWDNVAKLVAVGLNVPADSGKELKQRFRLYDQSKDNILYQYNRGLIETESFWSQVLKAGYKLEPNPDRIDVLVNAMRELTTVADNGVIQIIKDLKANGHHVYMLSNSTPEIYEGNKARYSYFDLMDGIYMSFMNGARKPEALAYNNVLLENKLNPAQCIFIDDKEENLEGAKAAGMDVIKYKLPTSADVLRKELKSRGCLIDRKTEY